MTATIHTCHICSGQFTGRKKKYCSDACVKASDVIRTTSALHRAKGKAKRDRMKADDPDAVKAHRRAQYLKYKPVENLTPNMRKACENCAKTGERKTKGLCTECHKISRGQLKLDWKRRKKEIALTIPRLTSLIKTIPTSKCKMCEKEYKPKTSDRKTFCSRRCSFDWVTGLGKLKSISFSVVRRKCIICHDWFSEHRKGADTCQSIQCVDQKNKTMYQKYAQEQRRKAVSEYTPREFSCAECSKHVVTSYGDTIAKFCSITCGKRHMKRNAKARRRAYVNGSSVVESVDPFKVFDRDGWRCQICMAKTPRSKRGSLHDRAPELDHILPLSKGGDHSYANTQCACRKCNGLKGDKIYGQIPLFAT